MNWIIENLNNALETWANYLNLIWDLLTQSPQDFKGGGIWRVVVDINGGLMAIGTALLVLFFVVGVVKTCGSFTEVKKPEHAIKLFIRFILAKLAVTSCIELLTALLTIVQGVMISIKANSGLTQASTYTVPSEIINAVEDVGFMQSIPLWFISVLGSLFITVLSFVMILTVYGRFFKLFMYTAIAPIPLSSFAGQPSSNIGKSFVKSYAAVCLEGAIIILACVIFTVYASSQPYAPTTDSAYTQIWKYELEIIFNMLVLVGSIKMSDRIVREMMGLG